MAWTIGQTKRKWGTGYAKRKKKKSQDEFGNHGTDFLLKLPQIRKKGKKKREARRKSTTKKATETRGEGVVKTQNYKIR